MFSFQEVSCYNHIKISIDLRLNCYVNRDFQWDHNLIEFIGTKEGWYNNDKVPILRSDNCYALGCFTCKERFHCTGLYNKFTLHADFTFYIKKGKEEA